MAPATTAPAEVHLTAAQACDLDLVLAGVVASGHVLGELSGTAGAWGRSGPAVAGAGAGTRSAVVPVPATTAEAALAAGSAVLLDAELTPVATMTDLRATDDGTHLSGELTAARPRESGPLAELRLDLSDPTHRGRAVLLLARAPVSDDDAALSAWAAGAGTRPLVLVPEGGTSPAHLPARVARDVALSLMRRLGRPDAEVRVVPLFLRDPTGDDRLAGLVTSTMGASPALRLTEASPSDGAATWSRVVQALAAGQTDATARDVEQDVGRRLLRWRPPRAQRGLVVLLTGLSGSGKSTLARDLDSHLQLWTGRSTTLLDGDVVRRLLSAGLGFDRASRELNVRRIGWVAARVAEHGGTAICSPIAPFDRTRREVRSMVEQVGDLVLVHVSTPLAECERRDRKGLYARARRGEIPEFTGITSPYEPPEDADVTVDTSVLTRQHARDAVVGHLERGGWITPAPS